MTKKTKQRLRLLENIPCDKRMHGLIGAVFMAIMIIFTLNLYILLSAIILTAWGIEFFQKWTKSGQYDNYDAIAVVVGGLIVLAPYIIRMM